MKWIRNIVVYLVQMVLAFLIASLITTDFIWQLLYAVGVFLLSEGIHQLKMRLPILKDMGWFIYGFVVFGLFIAYIIASVVSRPLYGSILRSNVYNIDKTCHTPPYSFEEDSGTNLFTANPHYLDTDSFHGFYGEAMIYDLDSGTLHTFVQQEVTEYTNVNDVTMSDQRLVVLGTDLHIEPGRSNVHQIILRDLATPTNYLLVEKEGVLSVASDGSHIYVSSAGAMFNAPVKVEVFDEDFSFVDVYFSSSGLLQEVYRHGNMEVFAYINGADLYVDGTLVRSLDVGEGPIVGPVTFEGDTFTILIGNGVAFRTFDSEGSIVSTRSVRALTNEIFSSFEGSLYETTEYRFLTRYTTDSIDSAATFYANGKTVCSGLSYSSGAVFPDGDTLYVLRDETLYPVTLNHYSAYNIWHDTHRLPISNFSISFLICLILRPWREDEWYSKYTI